ncbi:MAG: TRAP transporter substrate-binding protein DctP [Kiritimatiellia bacterium]
MLAVLQLPAGAAVTLKFATLAPDGSTWMQSFDAVRKEVAEVSGGNVKLKAYPSGVLGEEKDVLFKMKVGQVDGARFPRAGTNQVCHDADYLDDADAFPHLRGGRRAVMAAVGPRLEEQALKNGFVLLGWTEIGFNYLYSTVPVPLG